MCEGVQHVHDDGVYMYGGLGQEAAGLTKQYKPQNQFHNNKKIGPGAAGHRAHDGARDEPARPGGRAPALAHLPRVQGTWVFGVSVGDGDGVLEDADAEMGCGEFLAASRLTGAILHHNTNI